MLPASVLGTRLEEREVLLDHVLDAQEDVAEPGLLHQRHQRFAVRGERRSHALDDVVEIVQPSVDDAAAQRFEARDVDGDVVVDEEDDARAAAPRISDVLEHAREWEAVEVASPHFDDRAEAAIERAAARRLDDVDLTSHHRVAGQHPGGAVGRFDGAPFDGGDVSWQRAHEGSARTEPDTGDLCQRRPPLERAHQVAEGEVALAAHDHVDAKRRMRPGVRSEAWIVSANDDEDGRADRTDE